MMRTNTEVAAMLSAFEPYANNDAPNMEVFAVCDTLRWVLGLCDDEVFSEYVRIPIEPAELEHMVDRAQRLLRHLVDEQQGQQP